MIEELISRVFYARNVAHFEHWRAEGIGGYARHVALGEFYDGVIDAIDTLVEAYKVRSIWWVLYPPRRLRLLKS